MLSNSQFRILLGTVLVALALSSSLTADEVILDRRPYTAYDAIEEGYLNSEAQRMSLIDSQLDTVDRLNPYIVPVQLFRRRTYTRDPNVEGVYAYGRRGLFGLRPSGYIVVRRTPVVAYQQRQVFEPPPAPYSLGNDYGYSGRTAARQPIGHESRQTGPNRWEYRPLYGDDAELDAAHDEVARGQLADDEYAGDRARESRPAIETERTDRRPATSEPEELPPPRESQERRSPVRRASNIGAARDIARDEAARDDERAAEEKQPRPRERARVKVPPPPVPDEGVQPAERATKKPAVKPDEPTEAPAEGPLLGDPNAGTKEF